MTQCLPPKFMVLIWLAGLCCAPAALAQLEFSAPAMLSRNVAFPPSGNDVHPAIAADGLGHWVAVWESDDDLGGTIGKDADILVARSSDGGAHWTYPAPLNSNAGSDTGGDHTPRVVTDGAGTWIAVWSSEENLAGRIGTDADILFSRSTDNGVTWSHVAALNTNAITDAGADTSPLLATDRHGNWVAVWNTTDPLGAKIGTEGDILAAHSSNGGVTWSYPTPLNTNAYADKGIDTIGGIEADGRGNWTAVWSSNTNLGGLTGTDNDIFVTRSNNLGTTWSWPAALNSTAKSDQDNDVDPRIETDSLGNWVVVWTIRFVHGQGSLYSNIQLSRSTNDGTSWSTAVILAQYGKTTAVASSQSMSVHSDKLAAPSYYYTESHQNEHPEIVTDGHGNWIVKWQYIDAWFATWPASGSGTTYYAYAARSTNAGASWSELPSSDGYFTFNHEGVYGPPILATDGSGTWMTIWESNDDFNGTIGSDYDIFCSRSKDTGSNWSNPSLLNGNASVQPAIDSDVQLATDRRGLWLAVWNSRDWRAGTGADDDIFIARSTNNGTSWSQPVPLNTNAASDTGNDDLPQIATNGAGKWVAVWQTRDGPFGQDHDILVAHSADDGMTWSAPQPLNADAAVDSRPDADVCLATDGLGNWIVAWVAYFRIGNSKCDVLAARSTDDGATWSAPIPMNAHSDAEIIVNLAPRIVTDSRGHWIVTWESRQSLGGTIGDDYDILMRLSADNGISWTMPRALNSNAASDNDWDFNCRVATDGLGNWIALWESENMGSDYDILMARSTDNGASWSAPVPLNTNAGTDTANDTKQVITTDGMGNWLAVWCFSPGVAYTDGSTVNMYIAHSTDNGANWTKPALLNANTSIANSIIPDAKGPSFVTDGKGHWVLAWDSNFVDVRYATATGLTVVRNAVTIPWRVFR